MAHLLMIPTRPEFKPHDTVKIEHATQWNFTLERRTALKAVLTQVQIAL
jgi:hypothetical protein